MQVEGWKLKSRAINKTIQDHFLRFKIWQFDRSGNSNGLPEHWCKQHQYLLSFQSYFSDLIWYFVWTAVDRSIQSFLWVFNFLLELQGDNGTSRQITISIINSPSECHSAQQTDLHHSYKAMQRLTDASLSHFEHNPCVVRGLQMRGLAHQIQGHVEKFKGLRQPV